MPFEPARFLPGKRLPAGHSSSKNRLFHPAPAIYGDKSAPCKSCRSGRTVRIFRGARIGGTGDRPSKDAAGHIRSQVLALIFTELPKTGGVGNFIRVTLGQIDREFQSRENGAYMPASPG
ncbi:hypothetical protein ACVCNR_10475 [Aquamicrobium terrae]